MAASMDGAENPLPVGSIIRFCSSILNRGGFSMEKPNKEKSILTLIGIVCLILIIVSLTTENIQGPDYWLIEWTAWIASVVAIVVSARIFWTGAQALHNFVTTGKFGGRCLENQEPLEKQ
jgi:hypothetical protein